MGMKIDFSDFQKLINDMKATENDFNDFLRSFLYRMANEILRKTRPKTPVDTGALRSHWTLGEITGSGTDIYVEILNPMEYATNIEYGHETKTGWYNGRFMLKTSIDYVESKMPAAYNLAFKKFCKDHGIGK